MYVYLYTYTSVSMAGSGENPLQLVDRWLCASYKDTNPIHEDPTHDLI